MKDIAEKHLKIVTAVVVILVLYWFARLPSISESERVDIASRFRFSSHALTELLSDQQRQIRPVSPGLEHFAAWISSVGASVALGDLDNDQLPNDVCYVDTRMDHVVVTPVPESGDRYEAFTLDPGSLFDRRTMCPTGCIPNDLNEDGMMDVLVYYWGRTPIAFLRRQNEELSARLSAADFVAQAVQADSRQPESQRWYTNAATFADVDGDGHGDLIIGNYFPDGARILDVTSTDTETMHDSMSRASNGGINRILLWKDASGGSSPSVLYHDAGDVLDVDGHPVSTGWTLAVAAADLDGDLLPEIYFGNDFGPDRMLHNRSEPGKPKFTLLHGRRTATTPASKVLGHDSFKGMGADFGDVNGDGQLDIYVSNIAAEYALEESHFLWVNTGSTELFQEGIAPYVDRSEDLGVSRSGWGWESRLADFDNDGVLEAIQATGFIRGDINRWPELHEVAMGNDVLLHSPRAWHRFHVGDDLSGHEHNPLFVRSQSGRFYDIADLVGAGEQQVTRGIATADVDGDGDLDFAIGNQWEASRFYRNQANHTGRFLGLRLVLPARGVTSPSIVRSGRPSLQLPTRYAIGATARIELPSGGTQLGFSDGGNGHSGSRSPDIHLGLGEIDAAQLLDVLVKWRDRSGRPQERVFQLQPGWHTIVLGDAETEQLAGLSK